MGKYLDNLVRKSLKDKKSPEGIMGKKINELSKEKRETFEYLFGESLYLIKRRWSKEKIDYNTEDVKQACMEAYDIAIGYDKDWCRKNKDSLMCRLIGESYNYSSKSR
ncbi:hypothetical protein KAI32_00600 [Candidatus Pacearchaeota archaeon]|nr:hypothetical protein [Candidatus Pacearchaeota archaeon]